MKANAILVDTRDNVLTVVNGVDEGDEVRYCNDGKLHCMTAAEDIPPCNKISLEAIEIGGLIIKYGEIIGVATERIGFGRHVSHMNIGSLPRDYRRELQ